MSKNISPVGSSFLFSIYFLRVLSPLEYSKILLSPFWLLHFIFHLLILLVSMLIKASADDKDFAVKLHLRLLWCPKILNQLWPHFFLLFLFDWSLLIINVVKFHRNSNVQKKFPGLSFSAISASIVIIVFMC